MQRFAGRAGGRAIVAGVGFFLCIGVALAAGKGATGPKQASSGGGVLAGLDPAQCGGFSAADAAAILGVPASGVERRVERVHGSLWMCSFAPRKGPPVIFSIEVAKSAAEAADQMERYRSNLGDDYSDLMGVGDDGVWTEVNKTVTCRKQNVTVQVQQPPGKIPQLRVAKAFFDKN